MPWQFGMLAAQFAARVGGQCEVIPSEDGQDLEIVEVPAGTEGVLPSGGRFSTKY